jgi:hypothetical protein
VWFTSASDDGDGDPCTGFELWRAPRPHPEANLAVSADGRRLEELDATTGEVVAVLAAWSDETGRPEGEGLADVGGGALPAVSPDGTTLAFVRGIGCGPEVVLRDLATGAEQVVAHEQAASPSVLALRWTADGAGVEVVTAG